MRNLKPVFQKDLKDCGVCCMQWIIMYYDGYISLEKLREDTYTDTSGTSAYHIIKAFQKWGFDSEGILENNIDDVNLYFPLIAHLKLSNGLEHFVVVKKVVNNIVYLMDPGNFYNKLTKDEFSKLFTGHIVLMQPRNTVIKLEKGKTLGDLFTNILKKEKFLIFQMVTTSILWTFFSISASYYLKIGSSIIGIDLSLLKYIILVFLIITVLKIGLYYIRSYYDNHLSTSIDAYLYPDFIKHLFNLPLKSIKSRTTGELVTRINEVASLKSLFNDIFITCFLDSILMLASIVILFLINEHLCYILVIFLIIYVIYSYIISRKIYKNVLVNINYQTDFNSLITEHLEIAESIKNLNITKKILQKIEKCLAKYLYHNYKFVAFLNITNLGKDFLLEICFFLINSYGFFGVYNNTLSIVDLFTFNLILSYCIEPVRNIIDLLPKYNYIKASFSKINEFINIDEEVIEEKKENLDGDIEFKGVSYSYNNYDYILKNLNFIIKKGSHILLNGPSGSGKSTICKLIYQSFLPNIGKIQIGGRNILDIDISTIRQNILYVSQDENLVTGTIKENITCDRLIDDEEFQKICNICEIESIVVKKKFRYNALIEPHSKNLSGGEKQRIILARALLKKANIIILDEALSEVDVELERKIIHNIRQNYRDKTIIYISHKNQKNEFKDILEIGDLNGLLQN